ncbi:MAG: protein kinase, partial [Microbispora sp.]|nr:protein kinase [Microbispora sp.]
MPEQHPRLLADRYELRTRIGRGTMGTVWRAYDRSLGREIAVKEIRQDPALSPRQRQELRERMMREGRMAARVSHPSVATIHDVIVSDGIPWIIMELVEGRSLEQVIDEEGPLPPRLVAEIGYDLLGALRAAHAQNILHRDVKPANVLLTDTGRVVLTDFGIAKALGDHALTQTGMVIGSPGYTAPERARGEYTGPESDLWSLGATLYFAVEGRPAYERATVSETLAALMTETADPPMQAGPLRPVLDGLLDKDYTTRLTPERAAAMLRYIADTPTDAIPAVRPAGPAPSSAGDTKNGPQSAAADSRGGTPARNSSGGDMTHDDEEDANRTLVVPRPTGSLRLPPRSPGTSAQPGPHSGTAAPAGTTAQPGAARPAPDGSAETHSATVPGRLPGRNPAAPQGPAFAGNGPTPGSAAQPGAPQPPGAGFAGPPAADPAA